MIHYVVENSPVQAGRLRDVRDRWACLELRLYGAATWALGYAQRNATATQRAGPDGDWVIDIDLPLVPECVNDSLNLVLDVSLNVLHHSRHRAF